MAASRFAVRVAEYRSGVAATIICRFPIGRPEPAAWIALNWTAPEPTLWPPSPATMNGLGLSGSPTIYSEAYLAGNIEGGEQFNWFYNDSNNDGRGLDPNGLGAHGESAGRRPAGAEPQRLFRRPAASRAASSFDGGGGTPHQAIYDTGSGWVPQGPTTQWTAQMKPIIFAEYGFATVDRCTNQPNVFFEPKSTESETPFWSVWNSSDGETLDAAPRRFSRQSRAANDL